MSDQNIDITAHPGSTRPKAPGLRDLAKLLKALPRANPGSALHEILGLIHVYDFKTLSARSGFAILWLFSRAYEELESQFLNDRTLTGISGSQNCTPTLKLLDALIQHIETGFDQVISASLDEENDKPLEPEELAAAVCVSIQMLSDSLRNAYCVYKAEPAGVWGKLHGLFKLAETQGFVDTAITLPSKQSSDVATVYKSTLILAISKPYQLAPGEVVKLTKVLSRVVAGVNLEPGPVADTARYFVDLNGRKGPQYGRNTDPARADSIRVLHLEDALDRLQLEVQQLSVGRDALSGRVVATQVAKNINNQLMRFELGLVEKRLHGWLRRRAERQTSEARIRFSLGLAGSHSVLSGKQPFEPEKELDSILGRESRYANSFRLMPTGMDVSLDSDAQPPEEQVAELGGFSVEHGVLRDWSKQGLRIEQNDANLSWNVGDLLAFRLGQAEDSKWILGCTRWKKLHGSQGRDFGVVYMGSRVQPVACRYDTEDEGAPFFRSLLLPGKTPSLITPSGIFERGEKLMLVGNGSILSIQLDEPLRTSPSFSQFQVVGRN